eukprot:jgi/Mesvir1/3435/Mv11932-RA.1
MANRGGHLANTCSSKTCSYRGRWNPYTAVSQFVFLLLLCLDPASGPVAAEPLLPSAADRHRRPSNALVPFNADLPRMVPSCVEWAVRPLDQVARTSAEEGGHVKLLNFGVKVDTSEGSFLAVDRHGGYGLGYAGINLGASYAVDLWVKNAFVNKPSLSPVGRHVLLSSVGSPPKWSVGVFEGNLSVHAVAHGVSTHIASLADYWADAATDWIRLTIVSQPNVQFFYINGAMVGRWAGNNGAPVREPLLMFGNSPEGQMSGTWGTWVRDLRLCSTADPRAATSANVDALAGLRNLLLGLRKEDTDWAGQLAGLRVVLVGNSKTLAGSGKGKVIDSYDAVFRFNALPLPNWRDFGRVTTHEVLGDLTQLCGCPDGGCCLQEHIDSIRARRFPARGAYTIIYAKNGRISQPIANLANVITQVTHISLHRHVAKYVNALMELEEEMRPRLMAGSHRSWADFGFRTGMRVLLLLLAHGVEKPAIVGFDLGKQDNPLFNGRRKWSAASDAFKYLPETLILQDLVKAGIIVDLMDPDIN